MKDRRWEMEDRRWEMEDGRWWAFIYDPPSTIHDLKRF
jgi:hypothetical protein